MQMHYISLLLTSIILCIVPGPNNLMIMASGLNFRYKDTYPHILGITVGAFILFAVVGLGLGKFFENHPLVHYVLSIMACVYLLFLAVKFGSIKPQNMSEEQYGRPLSFLQALLFQWVNPKVWAVSISLIAIYTYHTAHGNFYFRLLVVATVFTFSVFITKFVWLFCGVSAKKYLNTPLRQRIFNISTGVLLAIAVIPILYHLVWEVLQIAA